MEICFQPWLLSIETWRCQVLNNNQFVLGEANIICTYCILAYPHQLPTKTRTTPHLRESVYFLKGDLEATSPWWKIRIKYLRTLVWKWSIPMLSIIKFCYVCIQGFELDICPSSWKGHLRNIKILFQKRCKSEDVCESSLLVSFLFLPCRSLCP